MLPVRWIASYPRSGNRITRNLLANYLVDGPATDEEMGRLAPDIAALAGRGGLLQPDGDNPVIGGTFLLPDAPLLRRYEQATGQVVYLVRDPRTVIPSAVRQLGIAEQHRPEIAKRLLTSGLTDLAPGMFGPWAQHVLSWTTPPGLRGFLPEPAVLVVRFEDLRADPVWILREVVRFLELDDPQDAGRVQRALDYIKARQPPASPRRPSYQTFVHRPEPTPRPPRARDETLAALGDAVQEAYLDLMKKDGDFARCVRTFEYDT